MFYFLLFLLNKFFVAASKPTVEKNKTWFILYATSRGRNNKVFNSFTLGLIASIKNIQQNVRENIVQC